MSNYPDGTGPNDPNAPWNYKEPKMTEWEFCHVNYCKDCGECLDLDENDICEKCFKPEEIEE